MLRFAIAQELTPLLAHVHAVDDKHGKQSEGKEKGHSYSVYLTQSYTQRMKNHLRSG